MTAPLRRSTAAGRRAARSGHGVLALRGDRRRGPVASATATLLVVDAWFDTITATTHRD